MNSTALPKSLNDWLGRTPRSRKSRLRPMSKKREGERRIYLKKRKAFLAAHPYCQIWLRRIGKTEADVIDGAVWCDDSDGEALGAFRLVVPRSSEIHHTKKRGRYYLDESTWLAASKEEHRWVHDNPAQARAIGLLA